jgi:hypothetical protein
MTNREKGTSVLETMVAATLGAIVIGAALDVFVTHHGRFLNQRVSTELHEDIRGGVHLLASELRVAGIGALPDQPALTVASPDEVAFRANVNGVRGALGAAAPSGQDWVQIRPGAGWSKGKTVVLCGSLGCEEHVLARDGSSGRLALSGGLTRDFPAGSQVEVVNRVRYYLSRSDPRNAKLMREVDRGANPLIEHVEDFSLTYLRESGLPAPHVDEVRLVRIDLKTSGIDGRGGTVIRSHAREMGVRAL